MELRIRNFYLEEKHFFYFLSFAMIGFIYFINPVILLLILIIATDFVFSYLSFRKLDFGIDIMSIGIIYVTYFFGITYAFFLIPFTIITRLIIGKIHIKHFVKFGITLMVSFAASALKAIPFIQAATIIIICRYLVDTLINGTISGNYNLFGKSHHLASTLITISVISLFF